MQLTDQQLEVIQNIASALIGAGGMLGANWIKSKRTASQKASDIASVATDMTAKNLQSAQVLVDMWQEMLDEKEKTFQEAITSAKQSCTDQVDALRTEHEKFVSDLEAKVISLENEKNSLDKQIETLVQEITRLTTENKSLNHQIVKLTFNNNMQAEQDREILQGLLLKLAQYEDQLVIRRKEQDETTQDLILSEEELGDYENGEDLKGTG